ncbi:MAG TPA: hypothetical protein VNF91_07610 [Candidatus Acidoferrum sp.]|nr:hypothetical protein [Candidatus Acidoferrum sp.]
MDQAVIDKVKAEYTGTRELRWATHPSLPDWVIFQVPTRAELRMFYDQQEKSVPNARQMLIDTCVIWPAKKELNESIDAHPGLAGVWVGEILEGAGVTAQAKQGKA